ncbi:4423_t:CDS:1, partial [Gigaspora rosea]
ATTREADRLWAGAEVLGEITNKNTLGKRGRSDTGTAGVSKKIRKADKISSKICADLLKPLESAPKNVEDLKVLINTPLACKLPVSTNINEMRIQKATYLDAEARNCQLATHIIYVLGEAIPWRFREGGKSEDMSSS